MVFPASIEFMVDLIYWELQDLETIENTKFPDDERFNIYKVFKKFTDARA